MGLKPVRVERGTSLTRPPASTPQVKEEVKQSFLWFPEPDGETEEGSWVRGAPAALNFSCCRRKKKGLVGSEGQIGADLHLLSKRKLCTKGSSRVERKSQREVASIIRCVVNEIQLCSFAGVGWGGGGGLGDKYFTGSYSETCISLLPTLP